MLLSPERRPKGCRQKNNASKPYYASRITIIQSGKQVRQFSIYWVRKTVFMAKVHDVFSNWAGQERYSWDANQTYPTTLWLDLGLGTEWEPCARSKTRSNLQSPLYIGSSSKGNGTAFWCKQSMCIRRAGDKTEWNGRDHEWWGWTCTCLRQCISFLFKHCVGQ